jgi:chitosanase
MLAAALSVSVRAVSDASRAPVAPPMPERAGTGRTSEPREPRPGLTAEQKTRAAQLISVFENDTPEIRYDYIEDLGDGRGYTAGRAGFVTNERDFLRVVENYTKEVPGNPLAVYLPRLKTLAHTHSGSTDGLDGLPDAWKAAAGDPRFRGVQDRVTEAMYYRPALRRWNDLGGTAPLMLVVLYDTILQHGGGRDPDGLPALIRRANEAAGGSPADGVGERYWLDVFLHTRRKTLEHATNPETRDEWAESVGRCDALSQLLADGNLDFHGPIIAAPFGTQFTIP